MSADPVLEALLELAATLEELGVPMLVGGSLASISWGEPRFTRDVDVVAHLEERHAAPLAERLTDRWYVDAESIREAVRRQRSFNVIRLSGMVKIDVFVPRRVGHHDAKWGRAQPLRLAADDPREVLVTGPEDIVLQKLVWFRAGDEVSEQQWRDVTSLLRVRAGQLDEAYLDAWARTLEVADLLNRARLAASASEA